MYLSRKNQLLYAAFPHLAGTLHAVFTRRQTAYGGENAELDFGRSRQNPARQAVGACLNGMDLVFLNQVHGKQVAVIRDEHDLAAARRTPPTADAVITVIPETALVVRTADCQAVLLYDPVRRAAANIHSGWRGSIANIIGESVDAMVREFGSNPADLAAGIGPSLGPCCAEFIHYRQEIPERFWGYKHANNRFDFWRISRDQLRAAGLRQENIECANMCTRCNPHLFFSYRREGGTGRFAAVIGIERNHS